MDTKNVFLNILSSTDETPVEIAEKSLQKQAQRLKDKYKEHLKESRE
jgi:hypothetical protein